MSPRRQTDTFEFSPPDTARVARHLDDLIRAGQGWINLMPGFDEEEEQRTVAPSGLFGLFGNRQPPVTMCTLVPARANRSDIEGVTVGLLHPTGAKAVRRLAEAGVSLPPEWLVRQDHARRGLVVRAAPGSAPVDVIAWSIRAGTALCRQEMTGQWQAVVYLP